MRYKDYYKTLGVARDATPETIKAAYRRLARKYHPDVSREPLAELRFKEVGEAYKVLKDPAARASYDLESYSGYQSASRAEAKAQSARRTADSAPRKPMHDAPRPAPKRDDESFGDILGEIMGRPVPPRHRGLNVHGSDQRAKVQIDVEEAYTGTWRNVSMPTYVTDEYGAPIVSKRMLKVSIPKGLRSGQTLRLAGQGFPGMGEGRDGDLYLDIVIRPHRRYRVEGRDIYLDIPLSHTAASLGVLVNVPTPAGPVQLTIPPGSAFGRKMRLKGKGIPGEPAGDLYAVIVPAEAAGGGVAQKAYNALKSAFTFSPRQT
ncbi:MAG TPA: DnaJ C-terminal domain-containing protein [Oxalicibacterium sp.]|nr:DnaJ C-terminal domain-containing protein [Oxalicibacterium sp.]